MGEIKLKIASVVIGSGEGGGSGVAPYYADLPDKPSINGKTLSGNKTTEDLGLASSEQVVPSGGTTGQVLTKRSNLPNDVEWAPSSGVIGANANNLDAGSNATASIDENHILQLGIPVGQNAVNPFKGWFTTDNIPTTGQEGDYCYITDNGVTNVYKWNGTIFEQTTDVPDTDHTQSFASNESVNQVAIDDSHLVNPVNTANSTQPVLAQAEDVMQLKTKLEGVTASEVKTTVGEQISGYINGDGVPTAVSSTTTYVVIPLNNARSVRLLGSTNSSTGTGYASYAFWNAATYVDSSTVIEAHNWDVREGSANYAKEYTLAVPNGATHIAVTLSTATNQPNFYCYLKSGENVVDTINTAVDPANKKLFGEFIEISLGTSQTGRILSSSPYAWDVDSGKHYLVDIQQYRGKTIEVVAVETGSLASQIAFFTSNTLVDNEQPPYCSGTERILISAGTTRSFVVPEDCVYLYVLRYATNSNNVVNPKSVSVVFSETIDTQIDIKIAEAVESVESDIADTNERIDNLCYKNKEIQTKYSVKQKCYINSSNKWALSSSLYLSSGIDVEPGSQIIIISGELGGYYAFLTDVPDYKGISKSQSGDPIRNPSFCEGYTTRIHIDAETTTIVDIPDDCYYLYFYAGPIKSDYPYVPKLYEHVKLKDAGNYDFSEKDIFYFNNDDYITPRISSCAHPLRRIVNGTRVHCEPSVMFSHISDCHGLDNDANTERRWMDFINFSDYWKGKGYIDDTVDTGDLERGGFHNKKLEWRKNGENVLTIIGNHDTWDGSNWTAHVGTDAYNAFIKDYVELWEVMQPSDAETNGYCYYYKDYFKDNGLTTNKVETCVRAIFVDCMGFDKAQYDWVKGLLNEALNGIVGDYTALEPFGGEVAVVIFAHFPPLYWRTIPCSYSAKSSPSEDSTPGSGYNPDFAYLGRLVYEYQENGGIFAGYVGGHYHYDAIGKIVGSYTFSKWDEARTIDFNNDSYPQLVYLVSAGNTSLDLVLSNYTMVDRSESQNNFQLISFDVSGRRTRLIKIGCRIDAAMRIKDTIGVTFNKYNDFDASNDYSVNSRVVYEGKLYRFIAPHNSKAWDYADVVEDNRILE